MSQLLNPTQNSRELAVEQLLAEHGNANGTKNGPTGESKKTSKPRIPPLTREE